MAGWFRARRFRFLRWYWMLAILVGMVTILVGGIYWYINQPEFYAYVRQTIQRELGIDVQWRSLEWSLRGWLKIVDAQVEVGFNSIPLQVSADSMYVSRLISGKPEVEILGATIIAGTAVIGSVSGAGLQWTRELSNPKARIALERVWVDPFALPTELFSKKDAGSSHNQPSTVALNLSWLDTVTLSQSRISVPGLEGEYFWEGAVRLSHEGDSALLDLSVIPRWEEEDSRLDIQGKGALSTSQLQSLQIQAHHFPISVTGAVAMSLIADGTLSAVLEDEIFPSRGDLFLRGMDARWLEAGAVEVPNVTVFAQMAFSSQWIPLQATASIRHSTVAYRDSTDRLIPVSAGDLSLSYDPTSDKKIQAEGRLAMVDRYSLALGDFPFSASTVWSAGITVEPRNLGDIWAEWPMDRFPWMDRVGGRVSLEGAVEGQGTDLGAYRIKAELTEGEAMLDSARITEGKLSAEVTGQNSQGAVNLEGKANVALIAAGTHEIQLEHQFRVDGPFDWEHRTYDLCLYQWNAGVVKSVSGWIRNGNRWRLEGDSSLEDSIPKLREMLPVWGEALEGTGELYVQMGSGGEALEGSIHSPDFMVYSLSDEYSYGIQLRDLSVRGQYRGNPNRNYRLEIGAATPYITYGAQDIEWPGQALHLDVEGKEGTSMSARLRPPGGGEIRIAEQPKNRWDVHLTKLDLDSFLLPLMQRFVLDTSGDAPPGYAVKGDLSARLNYWMEGENPQVEGRARLDLRSLAVPIFPSFSMEDATVEIPVVFPLHYERLASEAISVKAKRIRWEGIDYPDVALTIPFVSNTLQLASHFVLPLFGGKITCDNLRIENWLGGDRSLEGTIQLDGLQLARVNALLPIVPAEGVASGRIERMVFSGDRLELKGELTLETFGGTVIVRDVFMRQSFGGAQLVGFSADIDRLDLQKLAAYFQYGTMDGILFGRMRNIQLIVPAPGSNDFIMPDRLDIEIYSDPKKEGMISRDTLFKIVDLSGKTDLDLSKIKIDQFRFRQIGLQVLLEGIELRMIGTLENDLFIAPSKNLFANKIGIRLSSSDKTLNFLDFWNKLLDQIGRTL